LCQRASKEEMIISYKEENKMASYLRPRRGQKSTAETQAIELKKGEVFFEIGNGGTPTTYASSAAVATGKSFGKIKMGNGTNTYQTLGYFIDVDTTVVAWTDPYPNNATSAAQGSQLYANLNAINTSANVKTIFNNIKSLLYKMATQVTKLNNDLSVKSIGYDWEMPNIFYATSEDSTSTLRIRRTGSIIYAHFNLITKQAVSASTLYTIATITDSVYIPTYRAVFKVGVFSGTLFNGDAKIYFNTDGTIQILFDTNQSSNRKYIQCDLITIKE
jgi:hypothetical protein